ncbi:uncharacterized protein ARMOST_17583 [Armillaria ostoyae]|uniref:Uncharacterized protein n=1 Tax=Armillaria ostoyae TaxID=47428 RepID=A0A284RZD6_ARMOS|nr:uncharacterized protein ARMOST_17583 [Armillaria ostoyae]
MVWPFAAMAHGMACWGCGHGRSLLGPCAVTNTNTIIVVPLQFFPTVAIPEFWLLRSFLTFSEKLPMTTLVKNSVSGNSSLSMPQELIDFTLDFLHDDIPTLRVCSLVSRAFLPCSRYHIYSNVFIVHTAELDIFRKYAGQLYQCQNLAALLEYSPHVAPLVTRFGILAMSESSFMEDVFTDTSLFPIIQSLLNLSHIEFIAGRNQGSWGDFPVATHKLFLAALRSLPLKTLILKGIDFQNDGRFEDVFTAAAANSALKHLSLVCENEGAETSEPYPPIRPPTNGLPALESLSISGPGTPRNISWLFFTQSLYSISGIRRLSLQIYRGTPSSVIQSLLNEMQETLEYFTLDISPQRDRKVGFDLSRHRNLSSFYIIVPDFPDFVPVPEMRLNPTLRTLIVEHVSRVWQSNLQYSLRICAEVDRLALPALERVHIRLHVSVHGMCYYYAHCNTCEVQVQNRDAGDLDSWKRQVEESMPLLKDRGILEVETIKQRYIVSFSDRADLDLFPVARGNDRRLAFA